MAEHVLGQDDAYIHHSTNGNGNTGQGHNVGIHTRVLHHDEDHQHSHRQQAGNQERGAEVHHHDQDDQDGNEDLQGQGFLQRAQGFLDQAGAVVEGHDLNLRDGAIIQGLAG